MSYGIEIREEMRRVPSVFQPFLTWLTGKPYRGQRALWASSSFSQTAAALCTLAGGALIAGVSFHTGGLALVFIPLGWIMIAGSARKIQVTLIHQCAHFDYSGNRRWDILIGNALGLLVWVDHFENYYHEHIEIHHTRQLGSAEDPDCKFLLALGFSETLTADGLWNRLWLTMVSPRFHWIFARSRFLSNLVRGAIPRVIAGWMILMIALPLAVYAWGWPMVLVAWLIPLFPVYHIAALLNFSSLHFWLLEQPKHLSFKQRLCGLTAGRFMGECPPQRGLKGRAKAWAWSRWWVRMLFVHLPLRVWVLPGDLPVHDYHHRHPLNANWADYLYLRQQDIAAGYPRWEIPYAENWGLSQCIDAVFRGMSKTETKLGVAK